MDALEAPKSKQEALEASGNRDRPQERKRLCDQDHRQGKPQVLFIENTPSRSELAYQHLCDRFWKHGPHDSLTTRSPARKLMFVGPPLRGLADRGKSWTP